MIGRYPGSSVTGGTAERSWSGTGVYHRRMSIYVLATVLTGAGVLFGVWRMVDGARRELGARIDATTAELRRELGGRIDAVNARIDAVRSVASAAFATVPLIGILFFAAPAPAQEFPVPEDFGVFVPLDAGASELSGLSGLRARGMSEAGLIVRSRRVGLDEAAFTRIVDVLDAGQSAPLVRLNLFPDVVVDALVDFHDVTASGYSWSGGVQADPMGSVAVAVSGDVLHAIVRTGGHVYTIAHVGEGEYSVRELDRSHLPDGMPPVVPPRGAFLDPPVPAYVDDPSRVDIAVFHTAQASRDAGGTDEIQALIDAWIADTNAAYVRSGIDHRLNLVLRQQVSYVEATDTDERSAPGQAIDCFDDADDGCLDLDEIREEFSADLVHLLISTGVPVDADTFSCGIAYMAGDYGVSELFCGSDTFAHEVGHNSGVNHDRYVEYDDTCDTNADVPCFGSSAAPYSVRVRQPKGLDVHRSVRVALADGDVVLEPVPRRGGRVLEAHAVLEPRPVVVRRFAGRLGHP